MSRNWRSSFIGVTGPYKPKSFGFYLTKSRGKLEKKKHKKEREEYARQVQEALEELKTFVDNPGSSLISDKIVSEQPISDPSGLLFYMDFPIMQSISTSATILNNANTTQRLNKKARKKKDEGDTEQSEI